MIQTRCHFLWTGLLFSLSLVLVGSVTAGNQNGAKATQPTVILFDNLGTYHHPITTNSEPAQRYFNQGMRLVYGFNHAEAIRAFEEVLRLDPHCAMAHWGIALALGPNLNDPMDNERGKKAYQAIQHAIALARHANAQERAYIEALAARYAADPETADRKALDRAYADAMRTLSHRYPDDLDAATLFAAALMNTRPWDYWTADSQPQEGTLELVAALESVLERNPDHIGAIHYYIHAVEASAQPERALPYARRLAAQIPGAGHLVHMPSHIYLRVGLYEDAGESNERAVEVDEAYIEKEQPTGLYPMMYYPHNIDFLWAARHMEGRSREAIAAARRLAARTTPEVAREAPPLEAWTAMPLCALVRFGKWDEILTEPRPPKDLVYMTAIWHYARALAFVRQDKVADAKKEFAQLETIANEMDAERAIMGRNTAKNLLAIATHIVAGEIAAKEEKIDSAITHLEQAVQVQDDLTYTEPPPWYYPVRQSLGAVLLAAGKNAAAEQVYRKDLEKNPDNGWSLYGLAQSLRAQGKGKDAAAVEEQFKKAWAKADVKLTASRF
ncbi:MAG: hypothetical protein AB7G75_09910 [Candidatus Binatia bacterium]